MPTLLTLFLSGFYFSEYESSAIVQTDGGPCAVIAPLQAFIVKQLLDKGDNSSWRDIKTDESNQLLVRAMTEILGQAVDSTKVKYSILLIDKETVTVNGEVPEEQMEVDAKSVLSEKCPSTSVVESTLESEFFHSHLR